MNMYHVNGSIFDMCGTNDPLYQTFVKALLRMNGNLDLAFEQWLNTLL